MLLILLLLLLLNFLLLLHSSEGVGAQRGSVLNFNLQSSISNLPKRNANIVLAAGRVVGGHPNIGLHLVRK